MEHKLFTNSVFLCIFYHILPVQKAPSYYLFSLCITLALFTHNHIYVVDFQPRQNVLTAANRVGEASHDVMDGVGREMAEDMDAAYQVGTYGHV